MLQEMLCDLCWSVTLEESTDGHLIVIAESDHVLSPNPEITIALCRVTGRCYDGPHANFPCSLATPYATFDVETVSVRVGEIVRLHCLSQGTPPITYEWSKVNGTLPDRAVKRNGILQINLAVVSDSGRYKCLVKNKVGQSDAIATVNVKCEYYVFVPQSFYSSILPSSPL